MAQYRALGVGDMLEADGEWANSILVTEGRAPSAAAGPPCAGFLGFDAAAMAEATGGAPLALLVENRHLRAVLNSALVAAGVGIFAPTRVERVEGSPPRQADAGWRRKVFAPQWRWPRTARPRACATPPGSASPAGATARWAWSAR